MENSFFAFATDNLFNKAKVEKHSVIVAVSRENRNKEKFIIEKLIGKRVNGLLFSVSRQTNDKTIFEQIKDRDFPLVLFDRGLKGLNFPNIVFDEGIKKTMTNKIIRTL